MYKGEKSVKRWRENNKEKYSQIRKECSKRYYQKNKELLNEKRNEWGRNRTKRIKELENELEYVRTIKDSAEGTLKEVREENKTLKENIAWYEKEEDRLRKENKKLKEKCERLEFDVDAWHQLKLLLEGEIEKLREELSAYDREYFDEDKKAKNIYKSQKENILMGKI